VVFIVHFTLPGSGIVQSVLCLGYGLDNMQLDSGYGYEIFLFSKTFRLAVGPVQPRIQWVPAVLSSGLKWPGHELEDLAISNAEVKNEWH
jgi:hypothetical protein